MAVISDCPTEHTLKHFFLGQNAQEEAASLEAHLESCERCLDKFSTLHAEDSLVEALQSPNRVVEQTATESDHLLAEWLKALRPESAILPGEAATVDEAPPEKGSGDTTVTYAFLKPSRNPHELGRLGRYEVRKVLGSGGMGVVFQAYDPDLQRLVALKTTLPALAENPSAKDRFKREARAAAAIKHDHIVTIYDVGEDHGIAYLAMEFLEGESLDQRIQRERRLPWREALRITRESAQGLAAAHERKLIHRDIKPGNIWLESVVRSPLSVATTSESLVEDQGPRTTDHARVKILDFGLALPTSDNANLTQSGAIVGTPAFMAPEQCRGQAVDARSDLFSLGCVLYRMATGEAPFRGNHAISTLIAIATTNPRSPKEVNPELPQAVCDLIQWMLAKNPADRPPSAAALVEAIQAIEQERVQPAAPVRTGRRPPIWAIAALAFGCLVGLLGYLGVVAPQPDDPPKKGELRPLADDPALKAVSGTGKRPRQFFADPAHALQGVLDYCEIAGVDADAFRQWHASLGSDFRLAFMNTRLGSGPVLYNALAVREKVPRLVRYRPDVPELPDAGLKDVWDALKLDGFRLLSCTVQPSAKDDANTTQSLLWIKDSASADWYVRPAGLAAVMDDLKAARGKGYRPYQFNMQRDGATFIPFVAPIQDRLWELEPSLSAEALLTAVKSYKDRGWRPDVLTPYFDGGRLRFLLVAVGNDDGPDWRFRMAMSHDEYKQEAAKQRERGLFPLSIVSYGDDADVQFAAIWVRFREPGTKAPEPTLPDPQQVADRKIKAASWASAGPKEVYIDGARALGEISDFRELIGGTPAQLRDWHEKLDPKFRVQYVSSRNGTGDILFNAVAIQEKAPHESRFHIQLTEEQGKQAYIQNGADGFRALVSSSSLDPGEKLPWNSTAIWVKDGNSSIFWHGWFYDVVSWTKDPKETPKDRRPIWIDARMAPDGGIGGNIALGPDLGRAWESFHTLTQDELLAAIEFYQRKGWRPDVLFPYMKDGEVRNNLVVVENSDKVDWRFRTGMSKAEYEKESAQQSALGLFPLTLSSYGNEADIRYAAIWVRFRAPRVEKAEAPPDAKTLADRALKAVTWSSPERKGRYADQARALTDVLDFCELVGGSARELRDWHEKLEPKWRVAHITSRRGSGPTLFNAVAVVDKKLLPSRIAIDLTDEETNQAYQRYEIMDRFRPLVVLANTSPEQKLPWMNTLLWVDDGNVFRNLFGSLQNIIDDNTEQKNNGLRPIYLNGAMLPGGPRYNTIMTRDHGRAWESHYKLSADELISRIESYQRKGWRPDLLAPHWIGETRFMLVGVENSDQVDWRFRMDMSLADYQKESSQQKRGGLFPLSLVSYGNDAEVRYAAIFVRFADPGKK